MSMSTGFDDGHLEGLAEKTIDWIDDAVLAAFDARLDPATGESVLDRLLAAGFTYREARAFVTVVGNTFESAMSQRRK